MKYLYVILSCEKYIETRCEWVRNTWLRDSSYVILADKSNKPKGVIGLHTGDEYDRACYKYLEFLRNYDYDANFFIFCDDDTFVFTERLEDYLETYDPDKMLYIGHEQVHPELRVMSGGAGFVLSRKTVQTLRNYLRNTPDSQIRKNPYGDVGISVWLRQFPTIHIHDSRFHTQSTGDDIKDIDKAFTFHYVTKDLFDFFNTHLPEKRKPCIKAFSFTCIRDIHLVRRIHKQLEDMGISHTMYVDETEMSKFPFPCKTRGHHPDGTNGFGRGGFYAKLECIKDMIANTQPGDTILDCDSDVLFEDSKHILQMVCEKDEYKGWCSLQVDNVKGNVFKYCSGAVKSYSHELANKIVNHDCASAIIDLMDSGFTPSEDCTTSYIAGLEGRITNMRPEYEWSIIQNPDECVVRVYKNIP
jgi:hypothetical protein